MALPLAIERNEIKLASPNGIVAGGTATFQLPKYRYHDLRLKLGGALADYPEIRVKCNTTTIRRYSAVEQDMMNQTDGMPSFADLGYLVIPFDSRGMRVREGEEETALNVGRPAGAEAQPNEITSCEVQIDIAAGATAPAIDVSASISSPIMGGANLIRHIVKTSRDASGAGEVDYHDFDYGTSDRAFIRRMFFKTENLALIKIKRNNDIIFERTRAANSGVLKERGFRVQQAGWTLVDRTEHGYAGGRINTLGSDIRITLDYTQATTNFPVLMEYLGTLTS